MEKRYKLIEISKFYCKNQEVHTTEYHDGYIDYDILCKINNKVCDEEHCNHKQLQLDGFTKEEMIEKMCQALEKFRMQLLADKEHLHLFSDKIAMKEILNALLEEK